MANKADVAYAVVAGHKLSIEEFKLALKEDMFTCDPMPKDDVEIAEVYITYVGSYYETPNRQGYICGKHPNKQVSGTPHKGTFCAWGIHLNEMETQYLTEANWKWIRNHFTEEQIKEQIKEQVAA